MLFKIIKLRFYISYLKKEKIMEDVKNSLLILIVTIILSLILVSLRCYFSDNDFKIQYVAIYTIGFTFWPLFSFIYDSVISFNYCKSAITRVGRDKELYESYKSITTLSIFKKDDVK